MRRLLPPVLVLSVAVLAASCVNLEPRETNIQYYVLGGPPEAPPDAPTASEAPADADAGVSVGLRRPRVADYLDTPDLVTRFGTHEVQFSEFHRWGEDLDAALNRTVAERLAVRPGIGAVDVAPWSPSTRHDVVVQLTVLRFEGAAPRRRDEDERLTGAAHLVVAWEIFAPSDDGPSGGTALARGTTNHREPDWRVGNHPQLVERLDAAVDVLVDALATRVRTVDPAQ